MSIVVTGTGLAVAGAGTPADLLAAAPAEPAPVVPADRLGRKGLRYHDRATQLALVAAHDALRTAGLVTGDPAPVPGQPGLPPRARLAVPPTSVAVVASSNFGNLDTVRDVVAVVAETGSTRLTSPIMAPRLSSNVVASEVAIRFGLRGANLMMCNGPTSGLDAVHWAATLIASGRVQHALVVGVEPDNDVVRALTGRDRVLDGAAAVVLEDASAAAARDASPLAELGDYARAGDTAESIARVTGAVPAGAIGAWFVPAGGPTDGPIGTESTDRHDLTARWGPASGALGVLQCVAAVGYFGAGGTSPACAIAGADLDDASSALLLRAPAAG